MKRLAVLAFFLVAGCGPIGVAQAHVLALGFKAGDTYRYKFHSTSQQTAGIGGTTIPIELDTTANETVKVNSVDSSGVADLTLALSDYTLKTVSAGITNTTTGVNPKSIEIKIRADGTVVSIDGSTVASGSPLAAFAGVGSGYFIAPVLPGNAVKVGDTWTKTYDQKDPNGSATIQIASNSKYVRDETINGISTAVVETKSDGTLTIAGPATTNVADAGVSMKGTFTTDVTTWIDPSSHRIVKSHSTSTDDLTLSFPAATSTQQNAFPITGPLTATGKGTADLNPA